MRRRSLLLRTVLLGLVPVVAWGQDDRPAPAAKPAAERQGDPLGSSLEALRDRDEAIAQRARRSLLRLAPLPASALPQLQRALSDYVAYPETEELLRLVAAVRPLEEALPVLVMEAERLVSASRPFGPRRRGDLEPWGAPDHMTSLRGGSPHELGVLCGAFAAESGPWRRRYLLALVASALQGAGTRPDRAEATLPTLRRALADQDVGVRAQALRALQELGPLAAPALPELVRRLQEIEPAKRDPHSSKRFRAGGDEALELYIVLAHSLGSAGEPAIGPLLEFSERVGESPLALVGRIGKAAKAEGRVLWWVPLRAYWAQLLLCSFGLALCWVGQAASRGSQRAWVRTWLSHSLAWLPILVAGVGCGIALSWAELHPFVPEPSLTLLPLPIAGGFSAALAAALVSVWVDVSFRQGAGEEVPAE